ncbi:membrane dipeptidase [Croceibacterium mercuriale]|uniref:Membrane dipeptidase n=1 Tax=Croceibacterium mercuriale TaxID=1572751 RepID=A0A0B2BVB6_9SPHN|nr:membrane dipeptidase [Croceibacterium mercuriale]
MRSAALTGATALALTMAASVNAQDIRRPEGLTLDMLATPAPPPEEVADAALEAAPVWDGHNDVPWQLRGRYNNVLLNFDFGNTRAQGAGPLETAMHTDLPRLAAGKVGAQFWSVYVSAALPEPEAVVATLEQIDVTRRLIARYPDELALALTSADVSRAMQQGKIASLMGMEGGHSIGSSLAVIRQMYALGARYLTLTHNRNTPWADSATADPEHDGLTGFGELVVREMQRIGMLVDLSHVSEATMLDTLDVIRAQQGAPVIFSHSGARAVADHPRNVPDSVLQRLPENGGIVMVVALPGFISNNVREWNTRQTAEVTRLEALYPDAADQVDAGLTEWLKINPPAQATIADMADHVDHIRNVAGIDHIGIGGDYDGMPSGPVGMEDVAGYPALFTELARRGYSQEDLEKISSRNMMRVLQRAEAYGADHAGDLPLETPVEDPA